MTADGRAGRLWDPSRIEMRFPGPASLGYPPAARSRASVEPRVVGLAEPVRPSRSRTSSSGTISATARSSSSSSMSPAVRIRPSGRRELASPRSSVSIGRLRSHNWGSPAVTATRSARLSQPWQTTRPIQPRVTTRAGRTRRARRLVRSLTSPDRARSGASGPAFAGRADSANARRRRLLQSPRSGTSPAGTP